MTASRHDLIARMDADDISLPTRFARQLALVDAGHDVVGSQIREFGTREQCPGRVRAVPVTGAEISRTIRLRSPFHHPSIMFDRRAVFAVGGYPDLPSMEDYGLFAKLFIGGARMANVPEPLVRYRVDAGAFARRGGIEMFVKELALQRYLYRLVVTNAWQFVRNTAVRGAFRLVPTAARTPVYRLVFATHLDKEKR